MAVRRRRPGGRRSCGPRGVAAAVLAQCVASLTGLCVCLSVTLIRDEVSRVNNTEACWLVGAASVQRCVIIELIHSGDGCDLAGVTATGWPL